MRNKTITVKILFIVCSIFLFTAISLMVLADYQLTKIIDKSQHSIYGEKLEAILRTLALKFQRLKATGMREAYEEGFKESALNDIRKAHYKSAGQSIYPFIVNFSGQVVLHPKYPFGDISPADTKYISNAKDLVEGDFLHTDDTGNTHWIIFKKFDAWSWLVGYEVPLEIKYADVRKFRNGFILIMVAITLLAFAILSVVISKAIKPVVRLTQASTAMAGGDLDRHIDTGGDDEIGVLARSFVHMRNSIKEKIAALADKNEQLEKSEQKFRAIFNQTFQFIGLLDTNGTLLKANQSALKPWGLEESDVINKPFWETLWWSHSPELQMKLRKAVKDAAQGKFIRFEARHIGPDGSPFYADFSLKPVINADGKIEMLIPESRDITERKRIEEEIQRRRAEFEAIFNSITDAVVFVDIDRRIHLINPAFTEILGYTIDEVRGKSTQFFYVSPELYEQKGRERFSVGAQPEHMVYEIEYRKKDGTVFTSETLGTKVVDANERVIGFIGIIRDITDRKKAEQERERLLRDLEIKNRELEQVVYVTSHDLRTPLVNIDGFSNELGNSVKELVYIIQKENISTEVKEKAALIVNENIPEALRFISISVEKMDSLLSGLLKLSRVGRAELKIEKLDMNRLMSDVYCIYKSQLDKTDVEINISELPPCKGDEIKINQVFSNLIGNAMKFVDPERPAIINISGHKEHRQSVYCVEDSGIGIAPEYHEQIFEVFRQLNPTHSGGEGLGLTIVHKILDMHGGKICVESEVGKGSKFIVSLPGV